MNNNLFIALFCTVVNVLDAGRYDFVWLRDLNNDAHRRHLDNGLSEELRFELKSGKKLINLQLRENPNVRADTDMYVVKTLPDGTKRAVKAPFTGNVSLKYYHDIDNGAFFTVRCVNSAKGPCTRTMDGFLRIGDKYFHIAPVSSHNDVDRLYTNRDYHDTLHVIREEMANDENFRLTNDTIKLAIEEEDVNKSFSVNLRELLEDQYLEESGLYERKRASAVYGVELLVAVDPPVWEKFYALADDDTDNAMNRVREYVSQVINGVALTYKSIKGRSFSIEITLKAITVIKKKEDGPYKKAKPFQQNGLLSIDDGDYLSAFKDWVIDTPGIPSRSDFDAAMMLTGYSLTGSSGISYMSAVCSEGGVALATEAGYFNTIMVASHELAHSLGADHDKGEGCSQGNIMWMNIPKLFNEYSHKAWEYSTCSIDAFQKTLSGKSCVKDAATFYNKKDYDNYNKLYPGQIYSPDEQCKIAFGPDSYRCSIPAPDKVCVTLSCYKPHEDSCGRQIAADGTQCGTGPNWCIDGQCVPKPSGVTTKKPTTTAFKGGNTPFTTPTQPSSCSDSDICKDMFEVYNQKKKFCSDFRNLCCATCKDEHKCEDEGYKDWSCADIRSFYEKKSKFCSKWSEKCCASCSKKITGK